MKLTYDPEKRARTMKERGLDFQDCAEVFAGPNIEIPDKRRDYSEDRTKTIGFLKGVAWWWRSGRRAMVGDASFQ
jgi:hypothetical protein